MDTTSLALIVLVTGIIVVFSVLILLSLIIKGYGGLINIFSKSAETKNTVQKYCKPTENKINQLNPEIVAAISAAVYSLFYSENKQVKIVEIKKEGLKDLSWKKIGVIENTRPFLRHI